MFTAIYGWQYGWACADLCNYARAATIHNLSLKALCILWPRVKLRHFDNSLWAAVYARNVRASLDPNFFPLRILGRDYHLW